MQKRISIVTPTYNQGHFIEQTIDSVLSQNYPNLEYIIIDGGSTDGTVEIIKKYAKHLKFWLSEKDHGQSDAINKGLLHCTGDIVNWINSDDYYQPDTFQIVNDYFSHLNPDVLLGKSRICFEGSDETIISKGSHLFESVEKTIGDALIDQPASFFKRDVFMRYYPIDTNLHYLMDRAIWVKYLLEFSTKKVSKISDVLVNFRMHKTSKTVSELPGFNLERDALFQSMKSHFLREHANTANSRSGEKQLSINWGNIRSSCDVNLVLMEYSAVLIKEAYARHEFEMAKTLMGSINLNQVSLESQKELKKLAMKMKYVPANTLKWLSQRKR